MANETVLTLTLKIVALLIIVAGFIVMFVYLKKTGKSFENLKDAAAEMQRLANVQSAYLTVLNIVSESANKTAQDTEEYVSQLENKK